VTDYLSQTWKLRYFWISLVRNDLRNRYRRSVIGMGWSLLHPILMTAVLCAVFSQLFGLSVRTFAPNLLSGLTFWGLITASVMDGCQSFLRSESYIRQQPAPLAIYSLRTALDAGFHFMLGMGVAVVLVWCIRGFGNLPALLCLIPTFALLFVLSWSLTTIMGIANVMFQDSQHLLQVIMQIAFYLTPIIYPRSMLLAKLEKQHVGWLIDLNPFAVLLELIRTPLLENSPPSMTHVVLGCAFCLAAALIAMLALAKFEKRMIFYL
jgi:lipopolysaccharide transport system permease protein